MTLFNTKNIPSMWEEKKNDLKKILVGYEQKSRFTFK